MSVAPLIFEPIYKPRVWGGRKLASLLHRSLPGNGSIGESWELVDLEQDQSVVATGPMRGRTLQQLVREWGADLSGRAPLVDGHFPLLLKFLDARESLSVQVHPDEAMARAMGRNIRVKHEAWYIVDAEPEGSIYRGFVRNVTSDEVAEAVHERRLVDLLHRIPVKKGHCYHLPAGTVHALGAGVLVAEVQTPSDVTYRLYDWDRIDPATGAPRDLHIDQALRCAVLGPAPAPTERNSHVASVWTAVTQLVRTDAFTVERVRMAAGVRQVIPYEEMVAWMVLEGAGRILYNHDQELPFGAGRTVLLPAALRGAAVETSENCLWLEVSVPVASSLAGFARPDREELRRMQAPGSGFVSIQVEGLPPS